MKAHQTHFLVEAPLGYRCISIISWPALCSYVLYYLEKILYAPLDSDYQGRLGGSQSQIITSWYRMISHPLKWKRSR